MNYQALKTEIDTDALVRGYAGMTDQQVADSLNNTIDREVNIDSLTGDEVFQSTAAAAWTALTEGKKNQWLAFCGRETIDPFGPANVQLVIDLFGVGSTTLTNLQTLRKRTVSRETELGLGNVDPGDVAQARAM